MNSDQKKFRLRFLTIGVFVVVFILLGKLYLVQIVHSEIYSNKADRQYIRPNASLFDRGLISFTTKKGEKIDAATLKTGYKIVINPSSITEPADVYNSLSFLMDVSEEEFFERVSKTTDPYEEIARRVPKDIATKIDEYNLEGVSVFKERWRYYPGDTLASHSVGFMSYRGDELRGQYGLEREYNELLERNTGDVYANFFVEIFRDIGDTITGKENEGSLVTTIEPSIQTFIEKENNNLRERWGARKAGMIVMNPKNGEIYGMTLSPGFDLNTYGEEENILIFNNDLVESVYEVGSIVKPLTLAIGLDTGSITRDTTFEDRGQLTLDGHTFYNHDLKVRGVVDIQEVINQSLNTGAAFVALKTGNKTFSDYMKKLIGEKTNIDLPNETDPLVSNLDSPRDIEHAQAAFGQGIAMSPIGITRALATLGNGGLLVNPHLAKEINYEVGINKSIKIDEPKRIFKEKTSEEISRILVNAVDEALLGGTVSLPNHSVAAKTGTAQIADTVNGGYYDDRLVHTFFGYFPAYDPEFIVFLYAVEPQGVQYSSDTLTHPFFNTAKFLINYYEIPPDRLKEKEDIDT